MKQLTVRMSGDERATIRQAACACGVTMAEYARGVLLRDARSMTGQAPQDVPSMVADIHEHLLEKAMSTTWGSEGAAAVEVLVKTGHERVDAERRVQAICTGQPDLNADAIVALAFKDNGKE